MRAKWLLFLFIALMGCIDPFVLKNNGNTELMVVEGIVSNAPGPYTIKLSLSSAIENFEYIPLKGCDVKIEDGSGNIYELTEFEAGIYKSDSSEFTGEIGQRYRTLIKRPNGNTYHSKWETILEPVGIKSVTAQVDKLKKPDEYTPRPGFQFYVEPQQSEADSVNLLWQVDATFKFNSDLKVYFYFDGSLKPFPNPDSFFTCYKTKRIPDIFIQSNAARKGGELLTQKLHFEDTYSKALTLKYALNVYQLRLGTRAFEYWNNLKTLKELQGQVFDRQPFQVVGNMQNTNNSNEQVLGYFMAAGVNHALKFFNWNSGQFKYGVCTITEPDIKLYQYIQWSRPSEWPIYVVMPENGGPRAVVDRGCYDCRAHNAQLKKPEFWE